MAVRHLVLLTIQQQILCLIYLNQTALKKINLALLAFFRFNRDFLLNRNSALFLHRLGHDKIIAMALLVCAEAYTDN